MNKLQRCPYYRCRSEAQLRQIQGSVLLYEVACTKCSARTLPWKTEKEAVLDWNKKKG